MKHSKTFSATSLATFRITSLLTDVMGQDPHISADNLIPRYLWDLGLGLRSKTVEMSCSIAMRVENYVGKPAAQIEGGVSHFDWNIQRPSPQPPWQPPWQPSEQLRFRPMSWARTLMYRARTSFQDISGIWDSGLDRGGFHYCISTHYILLSEIG